jgi:very-short-patch-repair endonuclease
MTFSKRIISAKHYLGASQNIKTKAQELRKKSTHAEQILWKHLRRRQQNGAFFRRQHPYGIYILDFYCFKSSIAIEVDGGIHLSKVEYDEERTRYLESSGITVLRFNNQEIENNIQSVIEKIKEYLVNQTLE